MAELLGTFSIQTVIIILLVGIPALIRFIAWCKKVWKERESFKEENIKKGMSIEQKQEKEAMEKKVVYDRIDTLETTIKKLTTILETQQKQIKLLIESDELDIKSWIKTQHEKWMPRNCIDSQTLDLVTQRFEIYEKEGDNSWAKRLVDDLKSLPIVSVIPVQRDEE